jgi:hypothetical protein
MLTITMEWISIFGISKEVDQGLHALFLAAARNSFGSGELGKAVELAQNISERISDFEPWFLNNSMSCAKANCNSAGVAGSAKGTRMKKNEDHS